MKKKHLKSSKSSAETKKIIEESSFLLKKGSDYYIHNDISIDSLSFQEILQIAEDTEQALKSQIYLDAVIGVHKIQDMNVVEGLQGGLEKLYSKHPVLRDYLKDRFNFIYSKNNLS
jgi:hypothetical protein